MIPPVPQGAPVANRGQVAGSRLTIRPRRRTSHVRPFCVAGSERLPVCSWDRAEKRPHPGRRHWPTDQTGVPSAGASRAKSRCRQALTTPVRRASSTPASTTRHPQPSSPCNPLATCSRLLRSLLRTTSRLPRSGGHSYIGASSANGVMVVDLRQLPGGVSYDDESGLLTIPAAAELDSVCSRGGSRRRLFSGTQSRRRRTRSTSGMRG